MKASNKHASRTKNPVDGGLKGGDNTIEELISGLNFLADRAKKSNLEIIHRVIAMAKNDVLIWAAHNDCDVSYQQGHRHNILFDAAMVIALDFISKYASIENEDLRKQVLASLEEIRTTKLPSNMNVNRQNDA